MPIRGLEYEMIWTDEIDETPLLEKMTRRKRCPLCTRVPRSEGAMYCDWCWQYLEIYRERIERPHRSQLDVDIAAIYAFCKHVEPYQARHLEHCKLTMDFPAQVAEALLVKRSPVYDWLLWVIVDAFTKPDGPDWTMIQSLKQGHIIPFEIWYEP